MCHVRSTCHIRSVCHVRSMCHVRSARHIRSVCYIRSAGCLSRCSALIWTEPLQYLSWGSLLILWLERGRVGAEEMTPWVRALAVHMRGPAFRREKLGVVTSACHPGLGRQTGESAKLAGLVGVKELGPRFGERPCLTGLRWWWPPLAFLGGGLAHAAAVDFALDFFAQNFFISWSDLIHCGWEPRAKQIQEFLGELLTQLHGLHVRMWPSLNYRTLSLLALRSDPTTQFGFGFRKESVMWLK